MPRPGTPDPGTLTRVIILSLRIELAPRSRYGRIRCLGLTLATPSGGRLTGGFGFALPGSWAARPPPPQGPIRTGPRKGGHGLGWPIRGPMEYFGLRGVQF